MRKTLHSKQKNMQVGNDWSYNTEERKQNSCEQEFNMSFCFLNGKYLFKLPLPSLTHLSTAVTLRIDSSLKLFALLAFSSTFPSHPYPSFFTPNPW